MPNKCSNMMKSRVAIYTCARKLARVLRDVVPELDKKQIF